MPQPLRGLAMTGVRTASPLSVSIAEKQQKTVGRDDPARRLAVIERMQLPASGTTTGRALQKHVSFTVALIRIPWKMERIAGR